MALTYEPFDAVTVSKLNEKLGGGIEAINREISNLEAKIATLESKIPTNVATQDYVNTKVANYLPLSGGTLTGNLNANNHYIYGLPNYMPIVGCAVNSQYVDQKTNRASQRYKLPMYTVKAHASINITLTLEITIDTNKFIGIYPISNTGLLYNCELSVNNYKVDAVYITMYNFTSFDVKPQVYFMVQYYI